MSYCVNIGTTRCGIGVVKTSKTSVHIHKYINLLRKHIPKIFGR
jgi:hypothetical protein